MTKKGLKVAEDFIKQLQVDLIRSNIINKIKEKDASVPEGLEAILIATVGLIVYSRMDKKFIRTILKGLKKSIKETKIAYDTIKDNEVKPIEQEKVELV